MRVLTTVKGDEDFKGRLKLKGVRVDMNGGWKQLITDGPLPRSWKGPYIEEKDYVLVSVKKNHPKFRRLVKIHRLLTGIQDLPDLVVDHINRNPLDNRLCNLRVVVGLPGSKGASLQARNQNPRNGSSHTGVVCVSPGKFKVVITGLDGNSKTLGIFADIKVAKRVHEEAKTEIMKVLEQEVKDELQSYLAKNNITLLPITL